MRGIVIRKIITGTRAYGENNVSVIGISFFNTSSCRFINVSPPVANVRGIEAESPACQNEKSRVRRGKWLAYNLTFRCLATSFAYKTDTTIPKPQFMYAPSKLTIEMAIIPCPFVFGSLADFVNPF